MRKICIINQKGGVAKTTTAVNLAAGLSRFDRKVLLIDFDAQGSVGLCFASESVKDIHDLLTEGADIHECIVHLGKNLDAVLSNSSLTKTEMAISGGKKRETLLREKMSSVKEYDYVIIDCPPSLGILTRNALLYAQEAFIPVSTNYLGIEGMRKVISEIDCINEAYAADLRVTKIIPTMFDRRNKNARESLTKIRNEFFEVAAEPIRINSKLAEAPLHGKSIFSYAKSSNGAKDYCVLVNSVIADEARIKRWSAQREKSAISMESPIKVSTLSCIF